MNKQEIQQFVDRLSSEEVADMLDAIQHRMVTSADSGRLSAGEYYQKVRTAVESIAKVDTRVKSQARRWCNARGVIAWLMTNYGISVAETARLMRLHHSTVIWGRRRMNDAVAYPKVYREEAMLLMDVQKLLNSQNQEEQEI